MTSLRNYGIALAALLVTMGFALVLTHNIQYVGATTVSNQAVANVVVPSFCSNDLPSNTLIQFGSVPSGTNVNTANLVTVSDNNGNLQSNVFIAGSTWTYLSNSFNTGNTLWNPSSLGSYGGNALTLYPTYVDTHSVLHVGSSTSNNFFFGVAVPFGQAPGAYAQKITFQNVCSTSNSMTYNVIAQLTVPGACFITISNTLINFGTINPGSSVPTANLIVDTNTGGNSNANILVAGGNWISGANQFYVANTLWAATSQSGYTGTPLQHNILQGFVDTQIEIVYPPTSNSNNIFFGVAVPPAQASGTYTQNIIIENTC